MKSACLGKTVPCEACAVTAKKIDREDDLARVYRKGENAAAFRIVARLRRQADGYDLMGKKQVARIVRAEADAIERGDWRTTL